jgi:hypothetical protein
MMVIMSEPMRYPKPPTSSPMLPRPKENVTLGVIGFCTAALPVVFFILAQIVGALTACHDGEARVLVCANAVATWGRFISAVSFFSAFVIIPIGFILAIIAAITRKGRVWGFVTIALCVLPIFFINVR